MIKASQTRAIIIAACLLSQAATARATTGGPEIATIPGWNPAQRVTELADAYIKAWFKAFPEEATYNAPPGARHDRLTDNSLAAVQAWEKIEDDLAVRLAEVREESLWGTPEWVTYGFLREALESSRGLRVCRNELWPANQMTGWQVRATQLLSMQPVGTADLRAQALARWRGLSRYVDTEIVNLKEGLRLGYSTPKRNVGLVLEQLDGILAAPVAESPFFNPATRDDDPAFRKAWEELVRDVIYPAVRRYRDYLKSKYLPAAREPQTVAANPDGARCYAASLRAYTGLVRSPREVFESGQRYIEQREAKMKSLGRKLFGTDDPAEIRKRLRDDRENRFKSRDELLAFSKAAVQRARQALPAWFGRLPKAGVVIEPQPEFQEKTDYSRYLSASEDGSRPGTYQINLYKPEEQTRASAERMAFHEVWPGHHLQSSLAQERPQAHPITRYLSNAGFAEGWARYADTILADEMGLYSSDFNRLSMYAGVPHAMVEDPGLHALGWTRQQVIDYILAKSHGSTPERAAKDVDRMAIMPGQVTTYGIGEQELVALREEARQALGPKFDLREFHDRVLENGSLTLGMLRQVIERWIAEKKAGGSTSASDAPPAPAGWSGRRWLVLLRTGWSRRTGSRDFLNVGPAGPHSPGFHKEAILFLIQERDILGVGVETVGTDAGQAGIFDPPFPHPHLDARRRQALSREPAEPRPVPRDRSGAHRGAAEDRHRQRQPAAGAGIGGGVGDRAARRAPRQRSTCHSSGQVCYLPDPHA